MAINPISHDEFVSLAVAEGVPLPLAAAFYGAESDFGRDKDAYISPQQRALSGRMSRDPGKIGYGSMQIIRDTFNSVMPGADFYGADDATLTRAGLRYLKKAVKADGTYDLDAAKNLYFGSKIDKSFSVESSTGKIRPAGVGDLPYIPSKHSGVAKKVSTIEMNVRGNLPAGGTLLALATNNVEQSSTGNTVADVQAKAQLGESVRLEAVDFAAAAAKRESAVEIKKNELLENEKKIREGQLKVLETFGSNPAGTFAAIERTGKVLQAEQLKLLGLGENLSFKGDADPNQVGVLKAALVHFASQYAFKPQQDKVTALMKSASDYNAVISGAQKNIDSAFTPTSTLISIDTAARQAGNDAINLDIKEAQFNTKIQQMNDAMLRAEMVQAGRDADRAVREARTVVQNAQTEAQTAYTQVKTQKLEADLAKAFGGNTDMDALNAAAERAIKAINPAAEYTPIQDKQIFLNRYGSKEWKERIANQLAAGSSTIMSNDVAANIDIINRGVTDVNQMNANFMIANTFTENTKKTLDDFATQQNRGKKTTWAQASRAMDPKQVQRAEEMAKATVRNKMGTPETPADGFNKQPLNMHPMATYIESAGIGGLSDILKNNGIDPQSLNSDVGMVATLVTKQKDGNLNVANPELMNALHDYYKNLAISRAKDKALLGMNIPMNPNIYLVRYGTDVFDLTKKPQLQMFVEKTKGSIDKMPAIFPSEDLARKDALYKIFGFGYPGTLPAQQ